MERFGRLEKYSLDPKNKRVYGARKEQWENVASTAKADIIEKENVSEVSEVHTIGKIDRAIYSCITRDIVTDEVIITDERIQHVKERHPNDFERYRSYLKQIIETPDYIIEANKPNTGVLLKEFIESGEKFKLILRLAIKSDPDKYKNSVVSFWKIGETTWRKVLKNKVILYSKQ